MGFLEPKPKIHRCDLPGLLYQAGTRWQCDDCSKIYRLEVTTQHSKWVKHWKPEVRIIYTV